MLDAQLIDPGEASRFSSGRVIHAGETSTVSICRGPQGEALAVKAYAKRAMAPRHHLNLRRELAALERLRRGGVPGVVRLLGTEETPDAYLLIFPAAPGGDLHRALRRAPWDEPRLRARVVAPLLRALARLHAAGLVHRDVKPENLFFGPEGLLLGDFGLAIDQTQERPISRVGTLDYMAPEVLAQPSAEEAARLPPSWLSSYDEKVDCWAVGVLVVEALTGRAPFAHASPHVAALKARFAPPPRLPDGVSPDCADFVRAALTQDPRRRPSAAQLLRHAWLRAGSEVGRCGGGGGARPTRPVAVRIRAGAGQPCGPNPAGAAPPVGSQLLMLSL